MASILHKPPAPFFIAAASVLSLPCTVMAGNLGPGQSATVVAGQNPESWVLNAATLTIERDATAFDIVAQHRSTVTIDGGSLSAPMRGLHLRNGSTALLTNATIISSTDRGLILANADLDTAWSVATVEGGYIAGATYGVSIAASGTLATRNATMEGTGSNGVGLGLFQGAVNIGEGSTVRGQLHGVRIFEDERGSTGLPSRRSVVIDGSRAEGVTGSGISVETRINQSTGATISIVNGSEIVGGNGIALDIAANAHIDATVDASTFDGGVRVAPGGSVVFALQNGSTLTGGMNGAVAATIGASSLWNVTENSSLDSLALNGGTVSFRAASDGSHRVATVRGDLSGAGGAVALHTVLNEGGALDRQQTDRLLIQGNVTTAGPTELVVTGSGDGALTDTNRNGIVDAGEGISLVQVAGSSRADAFTLRGGYVAAGPWQYTLHALGPGTTDPAQNALPSGDLNWDYRLGNRYVCEDDCAPVDPENPDPVDPDPTDPGTGNPGEPSLPEGPGREAVVPQLPSYLSAPAALLTYGDMMNDGLHQRLGDIRNGASHDPVGGEVFVRYLGGQLRYSSDLSFKRYGYDFDQQVNALQLGGSLIALDGDNGALRAGWAVDHGTTRVTPKAADGSSSAKYRANGVAGWITWQHGDGLWVDGVIGAIRYRGDVGTDMRGSDVARIRANGWTMSLEAGMPFAVGNEWTVEPRFQLRHQSLNFRDFVDGDNLSVKLGTAKQTSVLAGGRLSRTANPAFMPYVGLDLAHTRNGDPSLDVASEEWSIADRFGTGRVGNSYRVAAGAVSQLGRHVQIYGEGTYRHFVGGYGMQGLAGNIGVRVTF